MLKNITYSTLAGIAQVILQPCALTGVICLIAIAINSWTMAIGALIGSITGTITALLIKYEINDIEYGLYGFNATLIGIANVYLFQFSIASFTVLIVCCILSVFLANFISRKLSLIPFTSPFVLITWLVILLNPVLKLTPANSILNFTAPENIADILNGVGQVFLQDNFVTSGIILISLLLCSTSSFVWATIAISFSWTIAMLLNYPFTNLEIGLYGFNAVLTAIALRNYKTSLIPLAGISLTVVLTHMFILLDWPSFTAPFVMITWLLGFLFRSQDPEPKV